MNAKIKGGNLQPVEVIKGITVNVLPYEQYEYLMPTSDVGVGYGISEYAIRKTKTRHEDELIEGKHFVFAGTICPSGLQMPHNKLLWTKRGVVRLGFFIKSQRAKLFRDLAEELVIKLDEQTDLFGTTVSQKALPKKRRHNRLTQARMVSILADVCKIEDKALRMSITNKLMEGGNHGTV